MSASHFRVIGALDRGGGRYQRGTVTIDRESGTFRVRPLRRRKTYEMPLGVVADMVVRAIVMDELRQKKAAKKAKRGSRKS